MVRQGPTPARQRGFLLSWTASIGAVTAEALADLQRGTLASARSRLTAAVRAGRLRRHRPLAGHPSLYTITRAGLRSGGLRGLEPCRVSAANAMHLITCARVAALLAGAYPDHRVAGERELRRDERDFGASLASARLGTQSPGRSPLHRPDLVLWPGALGASGHACGDSRTRHRPVAVEVELTVKAHDRLTEICRAWARCRDVAGVIYVAAPETERALARAIAEADAEERVVVVPLSVFD